MNPPEGWKLVPVKPTEEMIKRGSVWAKYAEDAYKAMLAAAPTPPVPVLQLETQLSDRDVKALSDYLVQVATPPTQEDEPVAWLNPTANPYAPLDMHVQFQNPHDGKWIPLYTRPDDKLRRAAEEAYEILKAYLDDYGGYDCEYMTLENLRAALEK